MRRSSSIVSGLVALLLLVTAVTAVAQRQAIFDWTRLHNYQPSAAIVQLADDTTMNEQMRRLFYVYHPELDDRSLFSQHCPNASEKTIVLGCYINPRGIYLFDVTEPRLAGIEQVTAAHETLHAAYDRLNAKDKAQVNNLINQAYAKVQDQRIRTTIDSYQKSGADVTNELHSILGTEVRDLPSELETYYKRYFNDRIKIVNFSEQYEKVFSDRKAQLDAILNQINTIEGQLTALKADIDNRESSLSTERQSLERERANTRDAAAFNARVAAYNARVVEYQTKVSAYNQLVHQHNDVLKEYNALALEENELIKAIDSHPASVETQ